MSWNWALMPWHRWVSEAPESIEWLHEALVVLFPPSIGGTEVTDVPMGWDGVRCPMYSSSLSQRRRRPWWFLTSVTYISFYFQEWTDLRGRKMDLLCNHLVWSRAVNHFRMDSMNLDQCSFTFLRIAIEMNGFVVGGVDQCLVYNRLWDMRGHRWSAKSAICSLTQHNGNIHCELWSNISMFRFFFFRVHVILNCASSWCAFLHMLLKQDIYFHQSKIDAFKARWNMFIGPVRISNIWEKNMPLWYTF